MEVRMEYTQGRSRQAEVWVDGNLLVVCDALSPGGDPRPPGLLTQVKFSYMSVESVSWERAATENRAKKKLLEPVDRWSYVGYGQVVSIMPVVIDFGLIQMEDPNWTTDESLVGRYVKVAIDRLELVPAHEPDFPEDSG